MFAFSACLYFPFKRIVETLENVRLFAVERIEAVESVVKSTTDSKVQCLRWFCTIVHQAQVEEKKGKLYEVERIIN